MIKVGVVGATGYTGIELSRLLIGHPRVSLTNVYSKQHVGKPFHTLYPHLKNHTNLTLENFNIHQKFDLDVLFLALPHTSSHVFMATLIDNNPTLKIIDLSADFRFKNAQAFETAYKEIHQSPATLPAFTYGCPEIYGNDIKSSSYVANPGCYALSSLLGLYPLAKENCIKSAIIDAKSGVS
ncbi:MAG: N-acetyl-gamma-glutamyl-phosphate reductase, partial [Candidatus Margulisbacteria bacterium]|nr:N-acetyl-gamma-glutamyl-phosphate reductase [Candidatus Margulisiibacteriota bacterium]